VSLFHADDLSNWKARGGGPARWRIDGGVVTATPDSEEIRSRQRFGDCRLHLEWRTPAPRRGSGQDAGNSGLFLMGRYEIQILDSHGNQTYPDGQAAAIYGQVPPLVNASRPAGEWQSYDVVFHAPRFAGSELAAPARVTVQHNGVLVHDDQELLGATVHGSLPRYEPHPPAGPIALQYHGSPVQFRNLWVLPLGGPGETGPEAGETLGEGDVPGATLRLYDLRERIASLRPLVPDQAPNEERVVPELSLAGPQRTREGTALAGSYLSELFGELLVGKGGSHAFLLESEGPSRLEIDGLEVIDFAGAAGAGPPRAAVERSLAPGVHAFALRSLHPRREARLALLWKRPGAGRFRVVGGAALRTRAEPVRVVAPGKKEVLELRGERRPGQGMPVAGVHPAYRVVDIRPPGFEPQVGALAFHPGGDLYVGTFRPPDGSPDHDAQSALFRLRGTGGEGPAQVLVTRLPVAVPEPMGMAFVGEELFVSARDNLYRLLDRDGDGLPDAALPVTPGWIADNFHHFSPGLLHRREEGADFLYGTLGVSIHPRGTSLPSPPLRGTAWRVRVPEAGELADLELLAGGLRMPNGIGEGPGGAIFVTDNQGSWLPANKLIHLLPGRFYGHYNPTTRHPEKGYLGTPSLFAERGETPPALFLPHQEIHRSPSQVLLFADGGPFDGQLMVGELTMGGIQRALLEEVGGALQGAAFRFSQGFEGGVNRLARGPDGHVYVGMTGSRGNWSWRGTTHGLQRLERRREAPPVFEMRAVRALPEGFEVEFTEPVAPASAAHPGAIRVEQWHYAPSADYGGEKKELERLEVRKLQWLDGNRRVRLAIPGLRAGRVVYLRLDVVAQGGERPWSTETWYTLNAVPGSPTTAPDRGDRPVPGPAGAGP
jgi:hypothetical protein